MLCDGSSQLENNNTFLAAIDLISWRSSTQIERCHENIPNLVCFLQLMMVLWYGHVFRIHHHLWGESIDHQITIPQKYINAEFRYHPR